MKGFVAKACVSLVFLFHLFTCWFFGPVDAIEAGMFSRHKTRFIIIFRMYFVMSLVCCPLSTVAHSGLRDG